MKEHIGIVIVSYNVKHFLSQCLHSIFQSNAADFTYEVWVVDNNSVDGSVEMIHQQFPIVKTILNTQNVGFAKANNQALDKIKADYILILNPDTILEEKTLTECLQFMNQKPRCGALGVKMIDGSGTFLPESKRALPTVWNSFFKLSYLSDIFPRSKAFNNYYLGHLSEWETHKVDVLCGAFMFIRSNALNEVGFFDDAFFMYGEDIDLSYRILQKGWEVYYSPISTIVHFKGESTKKSSLKYHKHFYGAMQIYVEKHYSKTEASMFGKFIQLGILLRGMFSYVGKILRIWFWPVIDSLLMFLSLRIISKTWANFRFGDPKYYDNASLYSYFGMYIAIWILGLWLFGRYSKENNFFNRLQGVFSGTIMILVVYALLPEDMRSSRAILIAGAVVAFLVTTLTSLLTSINLFKNNSEKDVKTIALVGTFQENKKDPIPIGKKY
ncbi:MAG: glycosyltransferase [Saprospiraceae bacterium]